MHSDLGEGLPPNFYLPITLTQTSRRVCPGRHMADNTVWLTIASVLATLTLGKAKDERGKEIEIIGEFTHGAFRYVVRLSIQLSLLSTRHKVIRDPINVL